MLEALWGRGYVFCISVDCLPEGILSHNFGQWILLQPSFEIIIHTHLCTQIQ